MKTAILTTAGFEIQNHAVPAYGDNDVLVRSMACGVCSGDLFVYQNRAEMAATHGRLGHEASGEIVAVGRNVSSLKPGDMVTALAYPAYADYFVAPHSSLVKLPETIDPSYALGEAVACCVHAAGRFGIEPDDTVALIGCGFMGLLCLQLAKHHGAGFACAIDPIQERREMSIKFGADTTVDPVSTNGTGIPDDHGEFDVVIEAAGSQSALDLSTELVAQHGRIILIGYHQSNSGLRTVNMQQWNYKAVDVINGHVRRQDEKAEAMRRGMVLLEQGHITTEPLVTIYKFDNIEKAFQELNGRKPGLFKAVLRFD